jgi:LysR family transcriptional regulator, nitrogen assimilation regulatory protein
MTARESDALLRLGQIDLAVTLVATPPSDAELFAWERVFFVCSPDQMEPSDGPIPIAEALDYPLILPSSLSYIYGEILEGYARKQGLDMQAALFIDGLNPRKQAVLAGLGATFLTMPAIRQEVRDGLLVARDIEPPLLRPVVIREREGIDPEARDWMRRTIRGILRELAPGVTVPPEHEPVGNGRDRRGEPSEASNLR